MEIPGIGTVTKDEELNWYLSEPITVPVLGNRTCRFVVEAYDEDPDKEAFHAAINNFLSTDESVLKKAEPHIFRYYQDCNRNWEEGDDWFIAIESPGEIWSHIRLGTEPMVTRRAYGDKGIYISLECECDWEVEHGLQIVFKNGLEVNKIGQYDGNYTNADAYGDADFEDIVYVSFSDSET